MDNRGKLRLIRRLKKTEDQLLDEGVVLTHTHNKEHQEEEQEKELELMKAIEIEKIEEKYGKKGENATKNTEPPRA